MILTTMSMLVIAALGTTPGGRQGDGSNQTNAGAAADDVGGAAVARRYPGGGPHTGAVGSAVSVNAEEGYWVLGLPDVRWYGAFDSPRVVVSGFGADGGTAHPAAGDGWWALGRMYVQLPVEAVNDVPRLPLAQLAVRDGADHAAGEAAPPAATRAAVDLELGVQEGVAVTAFMAGYRSVSSDEATLQRFVERVIPCESRWDVYAVSPGGHKGLAQFADDSWAKAGGGDPFDPYQQGANTARWAAMTTPSEQWSCW